MEKLHIQKRITFLGSRIVYYICSSNVYVYSLDILNLMSAIDKFKNIMN